MRIIEKHACLTAADDEWLTIVSESDIAVVDGLDTASTSIGHQSTAGSGAKSKI